MLEPAVQPVRVAGMTIGRSGIGMIARPVVAMTVPRVRVMIARPVVAMTVPRVRVMIARPVVAMTVPRVRVMIARPVVAMIVLLVVAMTVPRVRVMIARPVVVMIVLLVVAMTVPRVPVMIARPVVVMIVLLVVAMTVPRVRVMIARPVVVMIVLLVVAMTVPRVRVMIVAVMIGQGAPHRARPMRNGGPMRSSVAPGVASTKPVQCRRSNAMSNAGRTKGPRVHAGNRRRSRSPVAVSPHPMNGRHQQLPSRRSTLALSAR